MELFYAMGVPATGDKFPLGLVFGVLGVAAVLLIAVVVLGIVRKGKTGQTSAAAPVEPEVTADGEETENSGM